MRFLIYKILLLSPFILAAFCTKLLDIAVIKDIELYYALFLILFLGVPHGAIDHIIFKKESPKKASLFTPIYWTLAILNTIFFFIIPLEITFIFLILSAFHFGQAQFSYDSFLKNKTIFQIFWGLTIISLLLSNNNESVIKYISSFNNSTFYPNLYNSLKNYYLFSGLLFLTITLKTLYLIFKKILFSVYIKELVLLIGMILFIYFSDIIVGFTAFFVFTHSLKVLEQEFYYLKKDYSSFSIVDFIKIIAPYSIMSYFFVGVLFLLSMYAFIKTPLSSLIIIIISSITLPHAVVMNLFYNGNKK